MPEGFVLSADAVRQLERLFRTNAAKYINDRPRRGRWHHHGGGGGRIHWAIGMGGELGGWDLELAEWCGGGMGSFPECDECTAPISVANVGALCGTGKNVKGYSPEVNYDPFGAFIVAEGFTDTCCREISSAQGNVPREYWVWAGTPNYECVDSIDAIECCPETNELKIVSRRRVIVEGIELCTILDPCSSSS